MTIPPVRSESSTIEERGEEKERGIVIIIRESVFDYKKLEKKVEDNKWCGFFLFVVPLRVINLRERNRPECPKWKNFFPSNHARYSIRKLVPALLSN